jgi:YcxB-like protein
MSYQVTFTYSKSLIRQTVIRFWWRVLGWKFFIALGVVIGSLVSLLVQGNTSWLVGVFASVLGLAITFMTLLYTIHYSNMMRKFREMGSSQATFTASESTFTLSSGIGTSTLQWSTVTEIWQFPKFWLLFFSKAQFVTFPLADLPREVRDFILQKVQATGGKIA